MNETLFLVTAGLLGLLIFGPSADCGRCDGEVIRKDIGIDHAGRNVDSIRYKDDL